MFRKTAKKLWVFISSAVAGVCLAFGAIALPPANVAKAAIDGSLSEEVTLNKIVSTNGVTAEDAENDFVSIDMGTAQTSVWFMTQFTGKNAPNYVLSNTGGLTTWNANSNNYALTNSNELNAGVMGVFNSLNVGKNGNYGAARANIDGTSGVGPGLKNFTDDVEYIQLVGYEKTPETTSSQTNITIYTFKIENGAATLVGEIVPTSANGGTYSYISARYFVLYGNVHSADLIAEDGTDNNPDSVTFQYAQPAATLTGMLKGVSDNYEYKDDIVNALGVTDDVSEKVEVPTTTNLSNTATLDKIKTDGYGAAESVSSIGFSGFSGETWFITQFTGANSPNFAVRSTKEFDAWSMDETSENYSGGNSAAGMLICTSCFENRREMRLFRGTNTSNTNGGNRRTIDGMATGGYWNGPGNEYYHASTEYILIVGYSQNADVSTSADVSVYIYKVSNGSISSCFTGKGTATYAWNALTGSTAVIYGNIGTTANQQGPDSVTFSYGQPATSLEGLINGLSNNYAYKDDLATALDVTLSAASTYTATFEDLEGNTLKTLTEVEAVKLPSSTLADFVGWYNEADGKLYKAGEIVAVTANTTFVEVAAGIALEDGAAVRLKNDVVGMGGLRFEAVFSKAAIELLGDNVTLKGAVIPTDLLTGELALGNATAGYVALENLVEVDGEYHAYITLTNIKLENFQRKFSARAFFTVTYADGSNGTVASAYDEEKNSRSIYEVAVKAYNSGKYGEHEMLKYYLDNTVNVAVEVVDTEYTVTTEHTYDGLKADFARGYTVSEVSRDGATITFTVTLSGLTLTEDFSVTIWTDADSFETQIVTFTNGVATVNFTMAL